MVRTALMCRSWGLACFSGLASASPAARIHPRKRRESSLRRLPSATPCSAKSPITRTTPGGPPPSIRSRSRPGSRVIWRRSISRRVRKSRKARCSTRSTRGRTRPPLTPPRPRSPQNVASLELAKQNNTRFKKLAKDQAGAVTQVDLDKYQSQEDQAVADPGSSPGQPGDRQAQPGLDQGHRARHRADRPPARHPRQPDRGQSNDLDHDRGPGPHVGLLRRGRADRAPGPGAGPPGEVRAGHDGRTVAKIPFHLQLANEKGFPHEATLDFVNNQLDQATATLLLRAIFPNPKPATGPRVFAPNHVRARPRADEPPVPGAAGERRRPWERIRT